MMASNEKLGDETPMTCAVVGGRRFVGKSIVSRLLQSLDGGIVRIADLPPALVLDRDEQSSALFEALASGRASYIGVDVRNQSQVHEAIEGSSVVFLVDASDPSVQDFYHHYMFIVQGTKNVIKACRDCKVKRLIYNSSADVVFDGIHDIHDGDESSPYAEKFSDMLSDLKAQAEALVLSANGCDGLSTCALRPSSVFGPGDNRFISFLIHEAKSGWAKFVIGDGENMCDFTYVENVAHAHICAERALCLLQESVAGKAFFITNKEPMKMWEFVSLVLEGLCYPRPEFQVPVRLALFTVALLSWMRGRFKLHKSFYAQLSPAMVYLLSCNRTFNCSDAQKLIGYNPVVSLEEGITLTVESFSHLAEASPYSRHRDYHLPSKADKFLGSGKVANLLLWRDEKKTFTCFLALAFLFYWFILSGRTLISSTAEFLLFAAVIIFVQGILPSHIFGLCVWKIPSTYFEVSHSSLEDTFMCLATAWNEKVAATLTKLAQAREWNVFFKVAGLLYILEFVASFPFYVLVGAGLVCMFSIFVIYEQHEAQVDLLMAAIAGGSKRLKAILMRKLPPSMTSFLLNNYMSDEKNIHS